MRAVSRWRRASSTCTPTTTARCLIGDMANKTSQGVTSVVVGNCGVSLAPLTLRSAPPPPLDLIGAQADYRYATFADYMAALDRQPPAVNAACLVGHSTLRVGAMDRLDRPATGDEIAAMRARLREALDAGAIGLSTGLDYAPAEAAPTEEVQALAELLKPAGAIHTTHMRSEGDHVIEAMDEAFAIGRSADVPVVISHFKVHGKANWGRSAETLAKFEAQRVRQPLALDAYPYSASSTVLKSQELGEAPKVMVTWSVPHPEATGRMLDELAAEWGCSIEDAAKKLQPAGAVYFAMDEADVRRILSYPHTMIGSDGLPHDAHPHPRLWGSFPRVLGHYARERRPVPDGGSDPAHDVAAGGAFRPHRTRSPQAELCRRPRAVRSEDGEGPRDVRRSEASVGRHRRGVGEWQKRVARWQVNWCTPRPRVAPTADADCTFLKLD